MMKIVCQNSRNNDISRCQNEMLHANWIKLSGIKMKLFGNKNKYSINPEIDYSILRCVLNGELRFLFFGIVCLHTDANEDKVKERENLLFSSFFLSSFYSFPLSQFYYYFFFVRNFTSINRIWYVVTMWHTTCYSPITSIMPSIVLINYGNLFSHINPKYL